jgi:hypothetical protein
MSRGAGRVMREAQQRLTSTPTPVVILARDIYAVQEPTRSQVESVRRAVRRLVELGRAEAWRGTVYWPPGARWPDCEEMRATLNVRTALTAEEREQMRRRSLEVAEELRRLR